MSRTIKGLRFFLTCKVTNYCYRFTGAVGKQETPGPEKRMFSFTAQQTTRTTAYLCQFLKSHKDAAAVPRGCRTGTQNLNRIFFLGSSLPLLRRQTVSLFQSCLLYKYPGIKDLQKELEKSTFFNQN